MRAHASGLLSRSDSKPAATPLAIAFLALPFLSPPPALGQPQPLFAPPSWYSEEADTRSVALGDVDRDGDLDVVLGNYGGCTLYLNEGGRLGSSFAWKSPNQATTHIALGDVDGDGDLDLASASYGSRVRLLVYENSRFVEAWSSYAFDAWAVALGDVDGDGDLDLVCGNYNKPTTLYRNEGSLVFTGPETSGASEATGSLALGDVDGDGDLDLVRGNAPGEEHPATLYLNEGGNFGTVPVWFAGIRGDVNDTGEVALGDVNGDGDLDLVMACGDGGMGTTVYLNVGGSKVFGDTPSLSIAQPAPFTIALGDVDNDGDLDLACGSGFANQPGRLYLNESGTFDSIPDWRASQNDYTRSVALGDVDGDGDLDLVSGNDGRSVLYLNTSAARFDSAVLTGWPDPTSDVALKDIDRDGDLDLVCGNDLATTKLYLNTGRGFRPTPDWVSESPLPTTSVALGDVDNDGDLDLVCGNRGQPSALYRFSGAVFEPQPFWRGRPDSTESVALGDVDADGDLDLVCGNFGQRTTLYLNEGATFGATPAWSTVRADPTRDVALGDVDADGDLDLVCGNSSQGPLLYLNHDTLLDSLPAWLSDTPAGITSVALGDVDGDGDLDLVCGGASSETPLLFYRNNNGVAFDEPVGWGVFDGVEDVGLGDVDGDGDLDLVSGNSRSYDCLFLNSGNALERYYWVPPGFSSGTQAVALGDTDGDGDAELVCGKRGRQTAIYHGVTNPPLRGDPVAPRNHLPNNDAFVRASTVLEVGTNLLRVRLTAVDVESDPMWIVPDWRYGDLPSWNRVEVSAPGMHLLPFASSPSGVEHEFLWDTSRMPVDTRSVILRLRAVSNPGRAGMIQRVTQYQEEIGPVRVRRPMLSVSTRELSLPGVTVGDTVAAAFQISNRGNEPLIVHEISTSSAALLLDPVAPFTVGPSEHVLLALSFAPRGLGDVADSLWIGSDDPALPRHGFPLRTDVRDLDFAARLLAPQAEVPIGQALTAVLTPAAGVHIERAAVRYRKLGTTGLFSTSVLFPLGDDLVGTIPNASVTEGGIEYYFEVENSGVTKTVPDVGYFTQAVAAPDRIIARAIQTASFGFLSGRSITIEMQLPEGVDFVRGTLHYRRGGEQDYEIEPVVDTGGLPLARIPEDFVTARGVEFWAEVVTSTRTLTDPPSEAALAPRGLRVFVQSIEEPGVYPAGRFRLVSVPLDVGSGRTVDALLTDEAEFGSYDPVRWRLFRYVRETHTNAEFSPGSELFHAQPGRAFWLISRAEHRIDTSPADGLSIPTAAPYPLVVGPGWNQIGNPFAFPVAWESVGATQAVTFPLGFDPTLGAIGDFAEVTPPVLEPFAGYFVHSSASDPETLWVPPVQAPPLPRPAKTAAPVSSPDSWSVRVLASARDAIDGANAFGVDPRASDGHDPQDGVEPPLVPGPWLQVAFATRDGSSPSTLYRRDVRAAGHEGDVWELEVRSQGASEPVTLALLATSQLPATLAIRLLDREQQAAVDLLEPGGQLGSYSLVTHGPDRPYRLAFLAGSAAFLARQEAALGQIPARVVLEHGPNPFSSAARIRFGLPQAVRATLAIYDVRGQRVALLRQDEEVAAGYHLSIWNGTDAAGRPLASGVYFCRLDAGSTQLTRRIVLLR